MNKDDIMVCGKINSIDFEENEQRGKKLIFKILIRYILGYVNISVQGYYIERFINVCISKGIFLWNVRIEKSTYAHANVGIKDFKKIKEVCKKTKCKVTLNTRRGMPFFMNKYKKRKTFVILLVIISIFIYIESKFIWNIEIEGTNRISKEEILSELEECGLELGTLKSKVNVQEIINRIRLDRDDIAWMNINLRRNEYNCTNCRDDRKTRDNSSK